MFEFSVFRWLFSSSRPNASGARSVGRSSTSKDQSAGNFRARTEGDASIASCLQTIKDIEAILATSHVSYERVSMEVRRRSIGDPAAFATKSPNREQRIG